MGISELLEQSATRDLLRFAAVGSVDDGKSTLIGRLLHDARAIYDDHLQALRADSARVGTGPELDFALLTDGLRAEREQKITIDVAYRYFATATRNFIIADTPGHEQYTRNMATGCSTAHVAVILIDARHGVLTQTKRHSFIACLLGVPRLLIAVNKMDLVGYAVDVFTGIVDAYRSFATRLGVADLTFIPISALQGDNVVERSPRTPWYQGPSVLEWLESVDAGTGHNLVDFRLPVQYVVRPNLDFRGFSGQIAAGVVTVGDEVLIVPSMRRSRITSILSFAGEHEQAFAPMVVTVTLEDEIDVSRGDMLVHPGNPPHIASSFEAMLVWLAEEPMRADRAYLVKHTTRATKAVIERIDYRVDVDTLNRMPAASLALNEIGRVRVQTTRRLFLDAYARNRHTGSFIIIDPASNDTVGAGMVIDRLPAGPLEVPVAAAPPAANVVREVGGVSRESRERLLGQRAITIWLTGLSGSGKSSIARELERRWYEDGRHVCVLDGDNLRLGLNRDLAFSKDHRAENIRRVAEVARLFNDAGTIVLVPVISPFRDDREKARSIVGGESFVEVHVATPLAVCEARDRKGLYRRARAGEIAEFTGVSSPYEPPDRPFLRLETVGRTVEQCAADVLALLDPLVRRKPAQSP